MSRRPQAVRKLPSTERVRAAEAQASVARRRVSGLARSQAPELSYRCLFDAAREPTLVVDRTGSVQDANLAAARVLGARRSSLLGRDFLGLFSAASLENLQRAMTQARNEGRASAGGVNSASSVAEWHVRLCAVQVTPGDAVLLVHLQPGNAAPEIERTASPVFAAIESAPSGFVITGIDWRVRYANAAFVALLGFETGHKLEGESITRWLQLSEDDRQQLQQQLRERQAASRLLTRLQGTPDGGRQVEVLAVAVPDGELPCWGFSFSEIQGHRALN